jgi:hypothetical protein
MRNIDVVDKYIDHIGGENSAFELWEFKQWLTDVRNWSDEYVDKYASSMLQTHCNSHKTTSPARYVLECSGRGRYAYWFAMKPETARRSMKRATIDFKRFMLNDLKRRADAVAQRDPEMAAFMMVQHVRLGDVFNLLDRVVSEIEA